MFEEGMYLSVFFLCFFKDRLVDMLEEQKMEERGPDLEVVEYIMLLYYR